MGYALDIFLLVSSIIFLGFSIAYVVYFIRCHEFAVDNPTSQTPISATTALILIVFSSLLALISLAIMIWTIISISNEKKKRNQMETEGDVEMNNTDDKKAKKAKRIHKICSDETSSPEDYNKCAAKYN